MHPQLTDKKSVCREFIEALEACHTSNWARLSGGCNSTKTALNMCLREERINRSDAHRVQARAQRVLVEKAWKDLEIE